MLFIGTITFGIIIGYLAWHAMHLDKPGTNLTLKTIGAFISVVVGGAITRLFPAGTEMLGSYLAGVAIGFFCTLILRWLNMLIQAYRKQQARKQEQYTREVEREIKRINEQWPGIEKIVCHKVENDLFGLGITVDDLIEFPISIHGRFHIMQRFAQQHADEGYELDNSTDMGPRLRRNLLARMRFK